jgi:hypothetical protein
MEYQIFCNEESVDAYRRYERFLSQFDHDIPREKLYSNPRVLLEEIEYLENENLGLIARCEELTGKRDRNVQTLSVGISEAEREQERVESETSSLATVSLIDPRTRQIERATETVDRDLDALSTAIEAHFIKCFKKSADITALMMLERIEVGLEKMYATAARFSPQFVAERQQAIDHARRDDQRRRKQEAQEAEAQKKMKAALDRAKQPIRRVEGRPLYPKMLPATPVRKDTDTGLQEDEIREMLLYAPFEG